VAGEGAHELNCGLATLGCQLVGAILFITWTWMM